MPIICDIIEKVFVIKNSKKFKTQIFILLQYYYP